MALLDVVQVTKSFGERRAVDGVSFQVQAGQTVGLIGPNGAGKSTTVSMICGLLRADAGSITMDGQPVSAGNNAAKGKIGLVPQDLALYEDLSARENLRLFAALYGMPTAQARARSEQVLQLVNLSERAGELPSTFSGGMKRRLNIAAALMHAPQLLILDEPTVGVDPQSRNAIFDTLERLQAAGTALIYTSHYMEEVERLADHIVIIDHGKVLADESPDALYRRLPAQAALRIELAEPAPERVIAELRALPGVSGLDAAGGVLSLRLLGSEHAVGVIAWLSVHGLRPLHFATAKTNLEDIFLSLTGRSLRD